MEELFYNADNLIEQEELQTGDHSYNDRVQRAVVLSPLLEPMHFYSLHQYFSAVLLDSVNTNNTKLRAHMIQTTERGTQSDSLLHSSGHQSPPWTKLGVNPPYKPSGPEEELVHFQPMDEQFVYSESKHYPSRPVNIAERRSIEGLFKAVVRSQVTHGHISNESAVTLGTSLKRTDPRRGTDYFLEVTEKKRDGFIRKKFLHGLQELIPVEVTSLHAADYESTKVNFIVATPSVSRGFQRFIMSFENSFLARDPMEVVGMLVIMYTDEAFKSYDKDLFAVSTLITLYGNKYPEADLRLISTREKYSRLEMLKVASREYPSYELLFLADIHTDFSTQFLDRCRMNTLESKQVYFPAVFNPYDPAEFYKDKILYPYATKFHLSEERGSWMQDSFHLVCIYNYDLMKVLDRKGEEESGKEWSLVDHFIKQQELTIFRSVEPGLVHLWQDSCKEVEADSQEQKLCLLLEKTP
jgi:hypothetical protein